MSHVTSKSVRVELGDRSYDVLIGASLLEKVGECLFDQFSFSQALIITDSNVGPIYAGRCAQQFQQRVPTTILEVPAGEASKSIRQAEKLWEEVLAVGATRDALVIGLGGGVVGDLAGFVAATFARGLAFVQLPTTLLAQVDSSVGGKVGINLTTAKNMVGAFWQPKAVFIDLKALSTLSDREYSAGLAEVIKYGVIYDGDFFESLEVDHARILARDVPTLARVVARCCEIKAAVVAADEMETSGIREILNYGHTFAHAIESDSGYARYLHGEAVAIGMMCASELARRLGLVDEHLVDRQRALLEACNLRVSATTFDASRLLELMRTDKKVRDGRIRFVLPTRIGEVKVISEVDESLVLKAITAAS